MESAECKMIAFPTNSDDSWIIGKPGANKAEYSSIRKPDGPRWPWGFKVHFSRGKAITLDFELAVKQIVYGRDNPEFHALGIKYVQCVRNNGLVYTYRYYFCNNRFPKIWITKIWITNGAADMYLFTCHMLGKHSVNFNSQPAAIVSIMVQLLR